MNTNSDDKKISELEDQLSEEVNDDDNSDHDNSDHDNNDNDNSDDEVSVSKKFEQQANQFLVLDNSCKELQKQKAEMESQKKPLEEAILKYLEKTDFGTIEFPNGTKLRRNKSETKESLKLDHFTVALKEKIKDDYKIKEILEAMEAARETKVNVNLKRTNPRNTAKKLNKKTK